MVEESQGKAASAAASVPEGSEPATPPTSAATPAQAEPAPSQAAPVHRGVRGFAERHPQLASWTVLAVVMVALVLWSAKDVNLLIGQRTAIVLATIGLAGLCVWIIGWD